jgi:hypothetical protein
MELLVNYLVESTSYAAREGHIQRLMGIMCMYGRQSSMSWDDLYWTVHAAPMACVSARGRA